MILRKGKKMPFGGKGGAVKFNRDISPDEAGVKKAGVAHPNLENGAAAVKKGAKRAEGRAKKRSRKRD